MWIDSKIIDRCEKKLAAHCFFPESNFVVLGSGNDATKECYEEACKDDGVEILRRLGGGGTVVLYPGSLVISVGGWVKDYYNNSYYFQKINGAVISILQENWPGFENLAQRGISDLALGEKKIAGTSLFRSRHYVLYQCSLLVDPSGLELICRYLRHPSKEPEYREMKSHLDFLTFISEVQPSIEKNLLLNVFENQLQSFLEHSLHEDLLDFPTQEEVGYIKKRGDLF